MEHFHCFRSFFSNLHSNTLLLINGLSKPSISFILFMVFGRKRSDIATATSVSGWHHCSFDTEYRDIRYLNLDLIKIFTTVAFTFKWNWERTTMLPIPLFISHMLTWNVAYRNECKIHSTVFHVNLTDRTQLTSLVSGMIYFGEHGTCRLDLKMSSPKLEK